MENFTKNLIADGVEEQQECFGCGAKDFGDGCDECSGGCCMACCGTPEEEEDRTNYTEWTRAELDEYNKLNPMRQIDIKGCEEEEKQECIGCSSINYGDGCEGCSVCCVLCGCCGTPEEDAE